ncbi:hypothetical protein N0V83_006757 [Neocucurbitaria cava]|uniref:Uncharacterized protein n=1 Tax=Neocucurbitaria cava TaxID=798079 RepID=A0A9W9CKK2_9PLEO|nr:hypothetical protein N0V83_006757 [Neocucurbitaria cava]
MTYDDDVENREAASERPPTSGGASHQPLTHDQDQHKWSVLRVLQFFGGGIYAPDPSTYDPIEILLNTEDTEQRDELTVRWRDNKLSELSFIGVVAALLAGVLTSTGSWPNILPNGKQSPWPVRTSWYCGIVLALFSILSAANQTVRLHRLPSKAKLASNHGLADARDVLDDSDNLYDCGPELWDDNTKVAITYTVIALVAIIMFFMGQIAMHAPIRH